MGAMPLRLALLAAVAATALPAEAAALEEEDSREFYKHNILA
jgi:hypothetical protein